jgi:hypothetical protein
MTNKYQGFSEEEHLMAAKELRSIEAHLAVLRDLIWAKYGVSSKQGRAIEMLTSFAGPTSKVRSSLDDAFVWETGGRRSLGERSPYYGVPMEEVRTNR